MALTAIKSALEAQGMTMATICVTHTEARIIGAGTVTFYSVAQRHVLDGTFSGQVILIGRISFMSIDLLSALEQTRLTRVRLLCFGDWRQLPPVCPR